jgi:hypothetical protein
MRNARAHRFTVYDVMEAQGVFEDNPANSSSPDFKGPVQYPKIFYHPEGRERIIQRAEVLATPLGPQKVGELKELISRTVLDEAAEKTLRDAGWHDHPSKSIAASGREAPAVVSINREADLEDQIRSLQAELAIAKKAPKPRPINPDDAADATYRVVGTK